jgi:hypothetical protein
MLPQKGSQGSEVVQGMVVGSIPTAPTNHLPDGWILSRFARGQKGADKANHPVLVR